MGRIVRAGQFIGLERPTVVAEYPMTRSTQEQRARAGVEGIGPVYLQWVGEETQRCRERVMRQNRHRCPLHHHLQPSPYRFRLTALPTKRWRVWMYCTACTGLKGLPRALRS